MELHCVDDLRGVYKVRPPLLEPLAHLILNCDNWVTSHV